MGMASSQARLLMITSRMHDIEYQAANIQNAKLQLATQQDEAYEKYQKALDATTLTMQSINGISGEHSTIAANFSNVFGLNAALPAAGVTGNSGYILLDANGRVVVEDDIYEAYQNFNDANEWGINAYDFAAYMTMGGFDQDPAHHGHDQIIHQKYNSDSTLKNLLDSVLEKLGMTYSSSFTFTDLYEGNGGSEYQEALNAFLQYFYDKYGEQAIEETANYHQVPYNYDIHDFNYYVRIFSAIQEHGGCISISAFNGSSGDAATNSEWLTAMIQSGQLSIEMAKVDNHGNFTLNGVSVSSDSNLNYTPTTSLDKVALAKAEAEYEHTLKVIDNKDKKFDLSLKKLETERNALDKQREGIEKVIEDDVDRTFKIFS